MMLKPDQRQKLDDTDDQLFYDYPRFVTHVDDGFIQQLTDLYSDRLQPNNPYTRHDEQLGVPSPRRNGICSY